MKIVLRSSNLARKFKSFSRICNFSIDSAIFYIVIIKNLATQILFLLCYIVLHVLHMKIMRWKAIFLFSELLKNNFNNVAKIKLDCSCDRSPLNNQTVFE